MHNRLTAGELQAALGKVASGKPVVLLVGNEAVHLLKVVDGSDPDCVLLGGSTRVNFVKAPEFLPKSLKSLWAIVNDMQHFQVGQRDFCLRRIRDFTWLPRTGGGHVSSLRGGEEKAIGARCVGSDGASNG